MRRAGEPPLSDSTTADVNAGRPGTDVNASRTAGSVAEEEEEGAGRARGPSSGSAPTLRKRRQQQ